MLASITPLGERGRQATWGVTVTAFLLGATAAGAIAGALCGLLGATLIPAGVTERTRLIVLAASLLVAILLDTILRSIPGPHRQVDERWLDRYRGWVYGLGYGAQLGVGLTTVVSSAATYVALIAAFLAGNVVGGAIIVGCFGAVRGLQPLVAGYVRTPRQLFALHARLEHWRRPVRWGGCALLGVMLALALVGSVA
jgi:hypothetical protein